MVKITNPIHKGWTVYIYSGCRHSTKIKKLFNLFDLDYNIIDCDDCFTSSRIIEFTNFLKLLCGCEYPEFPLVFKNDEYIGGYKEALDYLKNKNIE